MIAALVVACVAVQSGATPPPSTLPVEPSTRWFEELELSVHADVVGRIDDSVVRTADGDAIDDRMRVRQVDLDLAAPALGGDERAQALVILSLVADPVNDFEARVEEAWFALRDWPFLADSPWDFGFRFGRFRSVFGGDNELRTFDLPHVTRPLLTRRFLGDEGFVQSGVSAFLASPGRRDDGAACFTWTAEALNAGDLPIVGIEGEEAFASVTTLEWALGDADRSLDAGLSLYRGKPDANDSLHDHMAGFDLAVRCSRGERPVHAGLEVVRAWLERPNGSTDEPNGLHVWGQVGLTAATFLGTRFDTVQDLVTPRLDTQAGGVFVSTFVNANLRFAFGWEHTWSDGPDDGADTIFAQAVFGFGSGARRPFWAR